MPKLTNLTGKRFGQLTVLERATHKGKNTMWLCRCDCGVEKIVRTDCLKTLGRPCKCFHPESQQARTVLLNGISLFLSANDIKRFWQKVDKSNDCWDWIGSKDFSGYGQFWLIQNRRMYAAHRISWLLHYGEISNELQVLHRCDRPECVNHSHLFLGTALENIADRNSKRRQAKGEKIHLAKLTWEKVEEIRQLHRDGLSQKEIAKMFEMDTGNICRIVNYKTWVN